MNDEEDEPAPPKPLPASDGGKRLPPRRTNLAYDDDSNSSRRPPHGFVIHPCQKKMVGTAEEQKQRIELHRVVMVGWDLRRNEDWQKMVDDHCSKWMLNREELERLLIETENMNPEDIEMLFPDIPNLEWRLFRANQDRNCREK